MDPTYRSVSLNMPQATSGWRIGSTSQYHYGSLVTCSKSSGYFIALIGRSVGLSHSSSCDFDDYEEIVYD